MVAEETIRGWQLDQLRKNITILRNVLNTIPAADVTALRDGGTGWTPLEVLCHLRDYEVIFLERARLSVEQEQPPLPSPNPDDFSLERRYNEQNLDAVYQEWVTHRETFLAYLSGLAKPAWARVGNHPKRGLMSVGDQLALICWHDVNHLEQILHIVAERKTG